MRKTKDAVVKMTDRLNPEALNPEALEAAARATYEMRNPESWARIWGELGIKEREEEWAKPARTAVSAYLAALPAPRTITTVEELEAMPAETVIKAADGNVYEQNTLDPRLSAQWVATGSKYPVVPECVELPALVLWVPTEGGGE